jgi:NADH pyrophosphatase NudC (nudix superfamily)
MSGAFIAQLSSLVLMYGTLRFCRKKGATKEKTAAEEKPQKQDDSAFIY